MNWFEGLDRDQIKAVIEFAARSLDENSFRLLLAADVRSL